MNKIELFYKQTNKRTNKQKKSALFIFVKSLNSKRVCYIIDFIVHVLSHFLQPKLNFSCFSSFPSVHTLLFMFHFLQSEVNLIHFICHSPSRSRLHYLVALKLHCYSTLLSVSFFNQSLPYVDINYLQDFR